MTSVVLAWRTQQNLGGMWSHYTPDEVGPAAQDEDKHSLIECISLS